MVRFVPACSNGASLLNRAGWAFACRPVFVFWRQGHRLAPGLGFHRASRFPLKPGECIADASGKYIG
jgi:hypothetical protein